jgi:hypothetical protein
MLTLERTRGELLSLPPLVHAGLVILVLGGLADVVAHLEAAGHADQLGEHTLSELTAHLIGFVGMVVILLGVVVHGLRQTFRGRPEETSTKGGL